MKFLRALWRDESGLVLSAEAVVIGTLGVVGATVGMTAVTRSVEAELDDVAMSIRSLDQSYRTPTFRSGGASTAGSSFTQLPVEEARAQLRKQIERDRKAAKQKLQDEGDDKPAKKKPGKKSRKETSNAEDASPDDV